VDPPGVRVDRLVEAIDVIKGLFAAKPLSYHGKHYRIGNLDGLPKPVQAPYPPLLIGGGSRRMLELAGARSGQSPASTPPCGPAANRAWRCWTRPTNG